MASSASGKKKNRQHATAFTGFGVVINPAPEPESIQNELQLFAQAMGIATALVVPMAVNAAIELGVLDVMAAAGPGAYLSPEEIAARLPTRNAEAPEMLRRLLGMLVSCELVHGNSTGSLSYRLAPVAKYFVRNEDGLSLSPYMALLHDKMLLDSWSKVKDAVLEGGTPFGKAHGKNTSVYSGKDHRFNQVLNTAMFNLSGMVMKKMLERYKGFEGLKQVVNVGGGIGSSLGLITSKYPSIKGINFDLPHVIQHAPPYPGVKHVAGDMFESVPTGDAIILQFVLRDWDDANCVKLLKNCYKATPPNGKVIIVEQVLPLVADLATVATAKFQGDVLMLAQSPGGKERNQSEFTELADKAGFAGWAFCGRAHHYNIMEFVKKLNTVKEAKCVFSLV